jgi:hypothetical protein
MSYHNLYEDFRPEFWYWKVVLVVRKVLLATIAILCDKRVAMQVGADSHTAS